MAASITIDAVFENGVFRPTEPLTVSLPQKVRLIVQMPQSSRTWPADVAAIYRALEEEERSVNNKMWGHFQETWPAEEVRL